MESLQKYCGGPVRISSASLLLSNEGDQGGSRVICDRLFNLGTEWCKPASKLWCRNAPRALPFLHHGQTSPVPCWIEDIWFCADPNSVWPAFPFMSCLQMRMCTRQTGSNYLSNAGPALPCLPKAQRDKWGLLSGCLHHLLSV